MLVLSRKPDESIVISGQITIKILGVAGDRVKIGIDAPADISIRRAELKKLIAAVDAESVTLSRTALCGSRIINSTAASHP